MLQPKHKAGLPVLADWHLANSNTKALPSALDSSLKEEATPNVTRKPPPIAGLELSNHDDNYNNTNPNTFTVREDGGATFSRSGKELHTLVRLGREI